MGPDSEEKVMGAEAPVENTTPPPTTTATAQDAPAAPTQQEAAPAAAASNKTVVSTVWPTGQFVVEDIPVITMDGVELDDSQLSTVKKMAELCEVKLNIQGGE